MPKPNKGFSDKEDRGITVPKHFFTDLLSKIQDIDVLKICLFTIFFLDQIEGDFRYLREDELLNDDHLIQYTGFDRNEASGRIKEALKKAVSAGFLLSITTQKDKAHETIYILNTAKGRALSEAIESGDVKPRTKRATDRLVNAEQLNIFHIYEQNIGPISPMISEALLEAEASYPAEWIEEAVRIAVENNVRRWVYIQTILDNWREEGRDERKSRRYSEEDRRRYIRGKYAEFIEHGDE